ncbi:ankyrin, partial [Colletotrichum falcatum]
LHIAAQKGHDRIVHMLLSHHGMDCNATDSEGRTPLMHAVVAGHVTVVRTLLDAGACCNGVDHMQRSVLHLAVMHRREHVLRLLLAE